MAADSTDPTRLTTNSATDQHPAFSPDGTRIAFTSNNEIYVMDADGSSPTRLTTNAVVDSFPVFSPDGGTVAYWAAETPDDPPRVHLVVNGVTSPVEVALKA